MTPGEVLLPHFHAVDQFQIFIAGSGGIGRTHADVTPVLVHYADHHTGYGRGTMYIPEGAAFVP